MAPFLISDFEVRRTQSPGCRQAAQLRRLPSSSTDGFLDRCPCTALFEWPMASTEARGCSGVQPRLRHQLPTSALADTSHELASCNQTYVATFDDDGDGAFTISVYAPAAL
jgi:hypothetical protein